MRITDDFLIKTSFTIALLGMLLLTIASRNINYNNHKAWTTINSNGNIRIRGKVINISQKNEFKIITIKFNTTVKGICTQEKIKTSGIRTGDYVTVSGSVSRGKLFIKSIEK